MKRFLAASLVAALLGAMLMMSTPVPAAAAGPCTGYRVTRTTGPVIRERRMRALIRCVFTEVGIPGQIDTALYVADRESNFYPWAWNHAYYYENDCLGLFQHMRKYWDGRARTYLPLRYFPHRDTITAFRPRANVWVTARMVKSGGWGPWSTL